ncbi:MAG: 50S ribosomal protein L35 [Candidatus Omnitrophota bacterium]|nr:50S ribosomal protein L35 [Candidatus Omnitrophota bacterium]MBU1894737.1 50S ribosomal protein L35 [Candidatus Omnitrophota bacterium]
MPKLKTKKGAKKRFSITKSGKIKRGKTGKRHILTKKSKKRKRHLSKSALVDTTFTKKIKSLLPYD